MVPDVEICSAINESKGFCISTVSESEREVVGENWTTIKDNSLVLPLESWQKLKVYILEVCTRYENCPKKEVEKKIELLSL